MTWIDLFRRALQAPTARQEHMILIHIMANQPCEIQDRKMARHLELMGYVYVAIYDTNPALHSYGLSRKGERRLAWLNQDDVNGALEDMRRMRQL